MATCRYPGCGDEDDSSTLPPGWSLVLVERRHETEADGALYAIERRRWLMCPRHAPLVDALCADRYRAWSQRNA
jgi:hypothetical protein